MANQALHRTQGWSALLRSSASVYIASWKRRRGPAPVSLAVILRQRKTSES